LAKLSEILGPSDTPNRDIGNIFFTTFPDLIDLIQEEIRLTNDISEWLSSIRSIPVPLEPEPILPPPKLVKHSHTVISITSKPAPQLKLVKASHTVISITPKPAPPPLPPQPVLPPPKLVKASKTVISITPKPAPPPPRPKLVKASHTVISITPKPAPPPLPPQPVLPPPKLVKNSQTVISVTPKPVLPQPKFVESSQTVISVTPKPVLPQPKFVESAGNAIQQDIIEFNDCWSEQIKCFGILIGHVSEFFKSLSDQSQNFGDEKFSLFQRVVEFESKFRDWNLLDQNMRKVENRVKNILQKDQLEVTTVSLPILPHPPTLRRLPSPLIVEISKLTEELRKLKEGRFVELQFVKERTQTKIEKLKKLHQDEIAAIIESYNQIIERQKNKPTE
jgi:hypothetical protein